MSNNEQRHNDNGSGKTPAWYIRHASLIIGLGLGLAFAAGFSYMKGDHHGDSAVNHSPVVESDVPSLD